MNQDGTEVLLIYLWNQVVKSDTHEQKPSQVKSIDTGTNWVGSSHLQVTLSSKSPNRSVHQVSHL